MSGTITTSQSHGIYLFSPSQNPVVVQPGVSVINTAGYGYGFASLQTYNWTITNFGTIVGKVPNSGFSDGILLENGGGIITNATGGYIYGSVAAVYTNGATSLTNDGRLAGNTAAGAVLGGNSHITNQSHGVIIGSYGIFAGGSDPSTVTNSGSIIGASAIGLMLLPGGALINRSGGLVDGYHFGARVFGAGSIDNAGTINSAATAQAAGVMMDAGGYLINRSGGVIRSRYLGVDIAVAADASAGSVVNLGSIYGSAVGVQAFDVASTVSNAGIISSGSSGTSVGVLLNAGGFASNTGVITGHGFGVEIAKVSGSVFNQGSISSSLFLYGAGVALTEGGSVTNAAGGQISSTWKGVQIGASLTEAVEGTVVNQGVILAADTLGDGAGVWLHGPGLIYNGPSGLISGGAFGIVAYYGGTTLINKGSIFATEYAFKAVNADVVNRVVLYPGSSITGLVDANDSIGSGAVSTLELASASSTGTLSGLGTQFRNFTQVVVDPGASWILGSNNEVTSGMTIQDQGQLFVSGQTVVGSGADLIGATAGAIGSEQISANGVWNGGTLVDGGAGNGALLIASGGAGHFTGIDVAASSTGAGALTVTGQNSLLTNTGAFVVGDGGVGSLQIQLGGSVLTTAGTGLPGLVVAATDGASGSSIGISGTGSSLGVTGALVVGQGGSGAMSVTRGASVAASTLNAGVSGEASGIITLSGTNAALVLTGTASIGLAGVGEVSILNGATLSVGGDLNIGEIAGGAGNIDIEGFSTLFIGGNLNLGAGGPAEITVGPNATVMLDNGGLNQGPNATLNLFNAIDPFFSSGGNINIKTTQTQYFPAYVSGTTFNLNPGVSYVLNTPTLYGGATFNIGASGSSLTLNADGASSNVTINFADATGTLVLGIDNLATIETPPSGTTVFSAEPNPNQGAALIGGFHGIIGGFVAGDTILVDTPVAATFSAIDATHVAVLGNDGTLGVLTFATAAQETAALNTPGALASAVVPCFRAGTLIRTDRGDVAVEDLAEGDRVWSVLQSRYEPVVWMGRRAVDCARHPAPGKVWPVRVAAGAFGAGAPVRDLWLSPDHAVYVDGVLVPVKHLVNGGAIAQVQVDRVEYFHIELRQHDVLLAEGLPAESYLDVGDRQNFASQSGAMTLHPSFGDFWESAGCAPLTVRGPVLDRVLARLASQERHAA